MTPRALIPWAVGSVVVCLVAAQLLGGRLGLIGMALGILTTTLSLGGTWLAVRIVAQVSRVEQAKAKDGTFWVVLAFLLKLPIIFVMTFAVRNVGGAALPCFLGGLALVYSWLIGWATFTSAHSA